MMGMGGMSRWWGPVFDAERTIQARRWQGYALRSLFVLGLLGGLMLVWSDLLRQTGQVTVRQMANVGASAYRILTILELTIVLVVAPAATAGAICLDKTRGALAHVFVTALTDREIILGKLAARLLPVWGLLACALPVAAMATWLGGIDPMALTAAFVIASGLAFLGCSFALMLSVWATKPHEVISVVFGLWATWLLAWPVSEIMLSMKRRNPSWLELTNPFFLAFATYDHPGQTSMVEPIVFSLVCGVIGVGFTAVAVRKVRVVGCRSATVQARRIGLIGRGLAWARSQIRWGKGPKLDANPVLWREWHRNRPSRWSKAVWGGFGAISTVSGIYMISRLLLGKGVSFNAELHALIIGVLATLGLLLLSASTASVLTEERARGSLDVLLCTPISTRSILKAKWWGSFRRVPWLAFWPVVVGGITAYMSRMGLVRVAIAYLVPVLIVAQGAALVSLGLALATWIKRTGQATAWTVAVLVVSVVGWPILGSFFPLFDPIKPRDHSSFRNMVMEWAISTGSPFFNVGLSLSSVFVEQSNTQGGIQAGILLLVVAWTLLYGAAAILLFEATVRTFDRCLGRMPERASVPRLSPPVRSKPRLTGWGWRIPGGASRRVGHAESFGPPPR